MKKEFFTAETEAWTGNGIEHILYSVWIDVTRVEGVAMRAAKNKSGRANSGPITVVITKREPRS